MLRALNPPGHRDPTPSYRLPWAVNRLFDSHPLVTNTGAAPVDFVRVFTHSRSGVATTEHWGQMLPGESVELCLCDADLDDTIITLAWFRQEDGAEYVWRFVM